MSIPVNTLPSHTNPSRARRGYEAPCLTTHGTVEQLTLGGENGETLDQNFKGFNNRNIKKALALS